MSFQRGTRLAGQAAGLGKLSFPGGIDNPGNSLPEPPTQAQFAAIRRQRLVEHLHRLGPAPLFHFLDEIENGASIPDHLERYARIDPDFVRALGGADFVPFLHLVPEER
jgi:hypothetical protein